MVSGMSLRDAAGQLQQLNSLQPTTPESAKVAIKQLDDLSAKILTIIQRGSGPMSPRDMRLMDVLSLQLAKLQGRFLKKSSTGIICQKMARVSRKEKVNEVRSRKGVEDQLKKMETIYPEDSKEAEKALNDLHKISAKIQEALDQFNKPLTPKERKYVKSMADTISELQSRFLKKFSSSTAIVKLKELLKEGDD